MDYRRFPQHDVLCIDMRSFYASVEAVKRGLDPLTTLLAVVGDPSRPGSVVLAASPALKRKYNLPNVSRFFDIPKYDPDIIIAPARMADYLKVSLEITKLLNEFAPKEAIHPYSIDEVWVTVDGLQTLFGTPWEIAEKIKSAILDRFGITSSVGIGDNKFLAKVVMDLYAKQTGIAECRYHQVQELLWPVTTNYVWGIGKQIEQRLLRLGIKNLGDLAQTDVATLRKYFGVIGEQLYWHAWGIDLSPVLGNFTKQEQKGFGHGITLLRDYTKNEVMACILDLCEEACRRARTANLAGRTIQLSISYTNGSKTSRGFNRSRSIQSHTNLTMDMYAICKQLFEAFYDGMSPIRRVSVALTNLTTDEHTQLDLFTDRSEEHELTKAIDFIKSKYGPTAILRGTSYTSGGVARDRSKKIGGHFF